MLDIHPTGGPLGVEIRNLDLQQPFESPTVMRLKNAFYEQGVLLFCNQDLTEEDQVHFTRFFCDPVAHPTNNRNRGSCPEITIISNLKKNGAPIGALGNAEVHFHKDLAFTYTPGTISVLFAVEVPEQGGDTSWANGYAAYDELDDTLKNQLSGLKIVTRHLRPDYRPENPAIWPIITTHPETGRKVLNISPNHAHRIEGLNEAESRALLDQLIAHATHPRFIWTHRWRAGDLVMWDNRCTMHRRDPFDDRQRRVMRRTQAVGPPSA